MSVSQLAFEHGRGIDRDDALAAVYNSVARVLQAQDMTPSGICEVHCTASSNMLGHDDTTLL